ncbi:MAG: transcriptional repressor LexA, partial [Myxococcales bacterium]|nr:transcriptional repressor LexA [Myxococcales bacterium]
RGYPPTIREIGAHMGIGSTNGVSDHLKALERKGYLERDLLKSRALKPVGLTGRSIEIPIIGRVAAGLPLLAEENIEDRVTIDHYFVGTNKPVFGLRVVGESMIEDGIYDGDYIFVKKQLTASAGDIVVALIEGEATVKRFYPEGDRIRFQPANSSMSPIYVYKREFKETQILGIVVGVYRKM